MEVTTIIAYLRQQFPDSALIIPNQLTTAAGNIICDITYSSEPTKNITTIGARIKEWHLGVVPANYTLIQRFEYLLIGMLYKVARSKNRTMTYNIQRGKENLLNVQMNTQTPEPTLYSSEDTQHVMTSVDQSHARTLQIGENQFVKALMTLTIVPQQNIPHPDSVLAFEAISQVLKNLSARADIVYTFGHDITFRVVIYKRRDGKVDVSVKLNV